MLPQCPESKTLRASCSMYLKTEHALNIYYLSNKTRARKLQENPPALLAQSLPEHLWQAEVQLKTMYHTSPPLGLFDQDSACSLTLDFTPLNYNTYMRF